MTNSNTGWGCRQISWLAAAIIGVVAAIILGASAHWGWFLAILAGIVVAVIAGLILTYFFCGEASAPASSASTTSTSEASAAPAPVAAAPADAASTQATASAAPAAATAAPAAVIKPSKALSGEEELASQKGDWKYEAPAAAAAPAAKPAKKAATKAAKPAAKAAPKAEKAAKPAAKATSAKAPAAKATKAKAATAKAATGKASADKATAAKAPAAAAAPAAEAGKPAALSSPRGGKADDLKIIEGIGPKLEEVVNSYGVYHFDQIAAWGADEVAWMDGNMPRFKGRVTRDKWVAQAKIIVADGIEAFLERAKTNDY